jgi:hypothetical protein
VKTRFDKVGYPQYCDAARTRATCGSTWQSPCTCHSRKRPGTRDRKAMPITLREPASEPVADSGIAEPSGKLPTGDVRLPGRPPDDGAGRAAQRFRARGRPASQA